MLSSPQSTALFNNASLGIVVVNSKGIIQTINPFALNLFGYSLEETLGNTIEMFVPQRFHNKHVSHRDKYIHNTRSRPMGLGMDLFALKKNGTEFPVEVSPGNYQNDNDQNVISFISDITIRKKAETQIKKLNDELEQTVEKRTRDLQEALRQLEKALEKEKELSELKSRFVSMASHEFRTPLSTVLSSSYLIEKYTTAEDQPKREKHLQRIISSVNVLTDILNDFLSVGKIEEGKIHVRPVQLNIRELITGISEEIKVNLKKQQEIRYHHEGNADVEIDPLLLKHTLMNLGSNAGKFSPERSPTEIKTRGGDQHLTLSVQDHGIGISGNDQKYLMECFFRGTNASHIQGIGLGLHIVSKYTELMNGTVACKSEPGKGTEFALLFA